jgi:hypothetical protein
VQTPLPRLLRTGTGRELETGFVDMGTRPGEEVGRSWGSRSGGKDLR